MRCGRSGSSCARSSPASGGRSADAEPGRRVRAVVFDVGGTLVDETRMWDGWAAWLGVPAGELRVALERAVAGGEHHHRALDAVRPGVDVAAEQRARAAAGVPDGFGAEDVYADAAPCLEALRAGGRLVGIAGNTSADVERFVRATFPAADMVASSAGLGCEKPAAAFFAAVAAALGLPPPEIAYVGDRVDNDVLPSLAAGMIAVHLRRGPWGRAHAAWPDAARAHIRIDSLAELPARVAAIGG